MEEKKHKQTRMICIGENRDHDYLMQKNNNNKMKHTHTHICIYVYKRGANTDAVRNRLKIYPVLWFTSANFLFFVSSSLYLRWLFPLGARVNKSTSFSLIFSLRRLFI